MKAILFAVTLFAAEVCLAASAGAASIATAKVSHSGSVFNTFTAHGITFAESAMDAGERTASAITLPGGGTYDGHMGSVSAGAFVIADKNSGQWSISASAEAEAGAAMFGAVSAYASAQAGFQDELTFYRSPTANDQSGLLDVSGWLELAGTIQGGALRRLFVDADASAGVAVVGIGIPPIDAVSSDHYRTVPGNTYTLEHSSVSTPFPKIINYTWFATPGVPFVIDLDLKVGAMAKVINGYTGDSFYGTAFGFSGFAHTLSWGGIMSVTDSVTGQPVEGWTVTSASGFDYTRTIPEPSSLGLLVAGLFGCVIKRIRR